MRFAVFGAAAAPFLPALGHGFVAWDDYTALLRDDFRGFSPANLRWMFTTFLLGHWQPLAWLTYALDDALWGARPFGHHLTSVLLHGLNAVLVSALGERLLARGRGASSPDAADRLGAAFAALLFGLHPLRAESVAWATERRDVLSGAFFLAAAWAHVRAAKGERWFGAARLAFGVGALMSKVTSLTLPAGLWVLDRFPLRRASKARELVPLAGAAAAAVAVGLAAQRASGALPGVAEIGLGERLYRAAFGLGFYAWKTVWPAGLSPLYTGEYAAARPWLAALGLAVLGAGALAWRAGRRGLGAAVAFYAATLFPMLGLVQSGRQAAADRYSYLATLGFSLLAGAGLARLLRERPRARTAALAGAGALAAALGAASAAQTGVWRDSAALWGRVLEVNPPSSSLALNLALGASEAGRSEEALALIKRLRAENPGFSFAREAEAIVRNNWGAALAREGRYEDAARQLELALPDAPDARMAHANLAAVLERLGRRREARMHREAAK